MSGATEHFCWKELAAACLYPHAWCINMLLRHINAPSESPSVRLSSPLSFLAMHAALHCPSGRQMCNPCRPSAMHAESLRAGMLLLYQVDKTILSKLCAILLSCL